jgi:hypothetical protein
MPSLAICSFRLGDEAQKLKSQAAFSAFSNYLVEQTSIKIFDGLDMID